MSRKLAKRDYHESNPHNNSKDKNSYYYYEVTNYQRAQLDAFRLMLYKKLSHPLKSAEFDQDLCKTLVMRYQLSCVDCKLDCEMHEWEALK